MASSRFKIIAAQTPEVTRELDHLFLSKNDKTGWSINTSIAETCQPTKACQVYCYGLTGRIALPGAIVRQAENAAFFSVADGDWGQIADEAIDITHVVSRQQDFLRMFGVGDLQPGSVYFINQMATYAQTAKPDFRIWVSTRKYDLAARLVESDNLHVMLSFDHSTPPKKLQLGLGQPHPRRKELRMALRDEIETERVPSWVSVVFEEHRVGRGRAKREPERRACPATVHEDHGGVDHNNACENCTFCFSAERRAEGPALVPLRKKKR